MLAAPHVAPYPMSVAIANRTHHHHHHLTAAPWHPSGILPQVELQEIVDFFLKPEAFRGSGSRIPRGVLLCGPPGTGKTLLAR